MRGARRCVLRKSLVCGGSSIGFAEGERGTRPTTGEHAHAEVRRAAGIPRGGCDCASPGAGFMFGGIELSGGATGETPGTREAPRADRLGSASRGRAGGCARTSLVVDGDGIGVGDRLAGQDVALFQFVVGERVVLAQRRMSLGDLGHAGGAVARLAGERGSESGSAGALEQGLAVVAGNGLLLAVQDDGDGALARG